MYLRKFGPLAFALVVFTCCFSLPETFAQTPRSAPQDDHDQTLKQLLTEVRELRLDLQRATVSNTRFQMLIERARVEQAHVISLRRELEGVRSQLSELQFMKPRMPQQIKEA